MTSITFFSDSSKALFVTQVVAPTEDERSDRRNVVLGEPLRGGVTGIIIDVPHGGYLSDFRVVFKDGCRLLCPSIDVCQQRGLRLPAADGRRG